MAIDILVWDYAKEQEINPPSRSSLVGLVGIQVLEM